MILNETAPAAKAVKDSDSSHWYLWTPDSRTWSPLYSDEKNFTLRDARKLKKEGQYVVPSVTTYFKVLHKQMLVDWKIEQALKVAAVEPFIRRDTLTPNYCPEKRDIEVEEWIDATAAKASNSSRGAADLGTQIHDAVEKATMDLEYDATMDVYVQPVLAKRSELALSTIGPEECLGSLEHGYAGRCDDRCDGLIIVDYKSRKTKPGKRAATYETDAMQCAAYGFAQWGPAFFVHGKAYIFVISTTEPGRVDAVEITGDELREAFSGFVGLMAVWRYIHDFDPRA